ncbi:hypothetical protein HUT19_18420 [Streptomyces sp. NA02950]|uniref:hypothetical protein n=1 Tax=Streptomyces sp. NA02950 TaxID=2742137 RepID=UPI001590B81C|nr:hypothetical protein [Streptomyces sp. NA02950]QKV90351.1 hypothetical protein HUT19_18420 [Streptomyces sp. NA02950]
MLDSGDSGPGANDGGPDDTGADGPLTSTVERGSFCVARCTCGWSGPARRARGLARDDATAHTTARHTPPNPR